jgi:hypothetical protein
MSVYAYKDVESPQKKEFNFLIVKNLAEFIKANPDLDLSNYYIIVLDSISMNTTRALLQGIDSLRPSQIIIVEKDPIVHQKHLESPLVRGRNGVNAVENNLFEFLKDCKKPILAIVADFTMSTLSEEMMQNLRDAVERCNVQRLYVTLARRSKGYTSDEKVIDGLMHENGMQHLEMIQYYSAKRNDEKDGKRRKVTITSTRGTNMRVFFFERAAAVPPRLPLRTVHYVKAIDNDHALVYFHGLKKAVKKPAAEAFADAIAMGYSLSECMSERSYNTPLRTLVPKKGIVLKRKLNS